MLPNQHDQMYIIKHSSAFTYADDTSSSVKDKVIEGVICKLEEDAKNVIIIIIIIIIIENNIIVNIFYVHVQLLMFVVVNF